MDISLEKIELVKDKTGVTYKESKEALESTEGNVVDAIINIEESINVNKTDASNLKEELLNKIKEIVEKGNVSKIIVRKDNDVLINLPLNAGLVGAVLSPVATIVGIVAAFGFKCTIELRKIDGSSVDLTEKAGKYYEIAREKAPEVYETVKTKSLETYENIVSSDAYKNIKEKSVNKINKLKEKGEETYDSLKEKVDVASVKEFGEEIIDKNKEVYETLKNKRDALFESLDKNEKNNDLVLE